MLALAIRFSVSARIRPPLSFPFFLSLPARVAHVFDCFSLSLSLSLSLSVSLSQEIYRFRKSVSSEPRGRAESDAARATAFYRGSKALFIKLKRLNFS